MLVSQDIPGLDRLVPFALFALYLITSVRLCRYSAWARAGAPNPFLPRRIDVAASRHEVSRLIDREVLAARSRQPL